MSTAPKTLLQLAGYLAKAALKGLLLRGFLAMTLAFLALLLHTWLVVVVQEGYDPSPRIWVTQWIALRGQVLSGSAIWGLAAFIATSLLWRFAFRGPIRTTRELLTAPSWVIAGFRRGGPLGVPIAVAGIAIGVAAGTLLGHRIAAVQLAIGIGLSVAMQGSGLLLIATALLWSDLNRWTSGLVSKRAPIAWLVVAQIGLVAGLARAAAMPLQPTTGWVTAVGLVLASIGLAAAAWLVRTSPATALGLAVWVLCALTGVALADDGGWQEAGGSFDRWIRSPGAGTAIAIGVGPALSVGIGVWTGGLVGGRPDDDLDPVELDDWMDDEEEEEEVEEEEEEVEEEEVEEEEVEEEEPPEDLPQDLKDGKDLANNVIGAGIPAWLLDTLYDVGQSADELQDAYNTWLRSQIEILEGGMVRFVDDAARAAKLDEIATAIRLEGWGRRLEGGALVVGIAFDAWENIRQGDSILWAIGKATGAGGLMAAIGKADPSVGWLELGNFLLFGGSEAADVISPQKNVGGAFNAIADTLAGADDVADRAQRGDYGPNLRNLGDAAAIGGEYWENPDEVGQELADFATDDQTWQDMYDRSHEVWEPRPGAWPPKEVALAAGELATDAVIKAGELAAGAGQLAGDLAQRAINQLDSWFR